MSLPSLSTLPLEQEMGEEGTTGPYGVEEEHDGMVRYWLHQGFLRTAVAPMDRVKFIMECQGELVRERRCRVGLAGTGGGVGEGSRSHGSSNSTSLVRRIKEMERGGGISSSTLSSSFSSSTTMAAEMEFRKALGGGPPVSTGSSSSFSPPPTGSSACSFFFWRGGRMGRSSTDTTSSHAGPSSSSWSSFGSGNGRRVPPGGVGSTIKTSSVPFSSSVAVFRHLCQQEGWRTGLWRGNSVQLTSIITQSLAYHHLSEIGMWLTELLLAPQSESGAQTTAFAGMIFTGFLCSLIFYPLEFLRLHVAVDVQGLWRGEEKGKRGGSLRGPSTPSSSFVPHPRRAAKTWSFFRGNALLRDTPSYCFTGLQMHLVGSVVYYKCYQMVTQALETWWWLHSPEYLYRDYYAASSSWDSTSTTTSTTTTGGGGTERNTLTTSTEDMVHSRSTAEHPPPPPPLHPLPSTHRGSTSVLPLLPWSSWLGSVMVDTVGTFAAITAAHPLDVVRRRRMVAVLHDHTRYRHSWDCAQQIWTTEGIRGFYRGLPIALGRMVVFGGLVQGVGFLEAELLRRRHQRGRGMY